MNRTIILFIAIALCLGLSPCGAQKKKGMPKAKAVVSQPTKTTADILYENMLPSTQCVLIIDSTVTSRNDFLSAIPLPPECGTLTMTGKGLEYVNEFGDKRLRTLSDSTGSCIYISEMIGNQWSNERPISGLSEAINPYLMPDGITLYLAQTGEESLGGYDLFVTRYDEESNQFLKPDNIGMPFNSKANEYLYIEDEIDSLGWFVTDRRQSGDSVCIYTFVPSSSRRNYNIETDGEKTVQERAAIISISDTWEGEQTRVANARKRLQQLRQRQKSSHKASETFHFAIADDIVYTSISQFRVAENQNRYRQLQEMQQMEKANEENLDTLRRQYAKAGAAEKQRLAPTILRAEQELERLRLDLKQMAKQIRNEEINTIK